MLKCGGKKKEGKLKSTFSIKTLFKYVKGGLGGAGGLERESGVKKLDMGEGGGLYINRS